MIITVRHSDCPLFASPYAAADSTSTAACILPAAHCSVDLALSCSLALPDNQASMAASSNERGQMLLAEEYFATENVSFVETLRTVHQLKPLAAFTDRWKKDPRPWARRQILSYL